MVKILLYLYLCFKIHDMLDLLMFSTWMNSNVIDTPHAPVLVLGQRIESFYCPFRCISNCLPSQLALLAEYQYREDSDPDLVHLTHTLVFYPSPL